MPVDLSRAYYEQYLQLVRQAQEHEAEGRLKGAAAAYRQAATLLTQYAGGALDRGVRERRLARARNLAQKASQLESGRAPLVTATETSADETFDEAAATLIRRSSVTWEDIAGLNETKREIKTAYALTLAQGPEGVRLAPPRTMLLYGPPGTGKTLLAAATSNGLDATFFSANFRAILSKYFGESSKLIGALYAEARNRAPAVIFLDEFDALSRSRGEDGESGAERRLLSTLLSELDGLDTKDDAGFVLTIAATNRPWDIDSAIHSRFGRQVYVPLPDDASRRRILEINLDDRGHHTAMSMESLVARTAGYSGREITQICEQSVAHMVGRVNPGLEGIVDQGREAVAGYQIRVEPLETRDFDAGFRAIGKPETTAADLRQFARWRQEG